MFLIVYTTELLIIYPSFFHHIFQTAPSVQALQTCLLHLGQTTNLEKGVFILLHLASGTTCQSIYEPLALFILLNVHWKPTFLRKALACNIYIFIMNIGFGGFYDILPIILLVCPHSLTILIVIFMFLILSFLIVL